MIQPSYETGQLMDETMLQDTNQQSYSPNGENILDLLYDTNATEYLSDDTLQDIGMAMVKYFEDDKQSCEEWRNQNDEWLKLASQYADKKSWPWPNASNVKYPLLTTAAIQFHARAMPALINDNAPVKCRILGGDPQGIKASRASRVSNYMSYKVMYAISNWVSEMDRLLIILPIIGVCYKKIYYSPTMRSELARLVLPHDLVINYNATDFARAHKTHVIYMDENEIIEFQREGLFREVELTPVSTNEHRDVEDKVTGQAPISTHFVPRTLLESHTWLDLDQDGYKEPWIVTTDLTTSKVLRIVPRFSRTNVRRTEDGRISKIIPNEYFVRYEFVPSPVSSIYGLGFGSLVGPLNSAIDTITNQLIDAGTLANLQGGFLGKGIRIKGGVTSFSPGEWKIVQNTGDDLRKSIFPLPIRDPSSALLSLLQLLIGSAERLVSVTDMMVGENPGQNQPYATTATVLEQGMKVYVGIYKRIFRALTEEYKLLFKIIQQNFNIEEYINYLDVEITDEQQLFILKLDFEEQNLDILPNADPNLMSEAQKMFKARSLLEKLAAGLPLNPALVTQKVLEAEGHENIPELMQSPPPQPNFDQQIAAQKNQLDAQIEAGKLQLESMKAQFSMMLDQAKAINLLAQVDQLGKDTDFNYFKALADKDSKDKATQATADAKARQQDSKSTK